MDLNKWASSQQVSYGTAALAGVLAALSAVGIFFSAAAALIGVGTFLFIAVVCLVDGILKGPAPMPSWLRTCIRIWHGGARDPRDS